MNSLDPDMALQTGQTDISEQCSIILYGSLYTGFTLFVVQLFIFHVYRLSFSFFEEKVKSI